MTSPPSPDSSRFVYSVCLSWLTSLPSRWYELQDGLLPTAVGRIAGCCQLLGITTTLLDAMRSFVNFTSHYVLTDPPPFHLYGWVDVSSSSNPLSLEGFTQSLLSYMQPQLPEKEELTDTNPIEDCLKLLTKYCCLVVIDGLQSMEDCWKLINARLIYEHHTDSCIILITADEKVATFWKETSSPHAVCNINQTSKRPTAGMYVCM